MSVCACASQQQDVSLADIARPKLDVPYARLAPAIGAAVDDPAWNDAAVIDYLTPCAGVDAAKHPPMPTSVRVMWDERYLYVRFISIEADPFSPFGTTRNADHYRGDVVEVFVDPIGDGREYFEVEINPAGGVLDVIHFVTTDAPPTPRLTLPRNQWRSGHWSDSQWTMQGLRAASTCEPMADGRMRWIADFALPAEVIMRRCDTDGFSPMTLRANFLRLDGPVDPATGRRAVLIGSNWSPTVLGLPHLSPAAMGYITLRPNRSGQPPVMTKG